MSGATLYANTKLLKMFFCNEDVACLLPNLQLAVQEDEGVPGGVAEVHRVLEGAPAVAADHHEAAGVGRAPRVDDGRKSLLEIGGLSGVQLESLVF